MSSSTSISESNEENNKIEKELSINANSDKEAQDDFFNSENNEQSVVDENYRSDDFNYIDEKLNSFNISINLDKLSKIFKL